MEWVGGSTSTAVLGNDVGPGGVDRGGGGGGGGSSVDVDSQAVRENGPPPSAAPRLTSRLDAGDAEAPPRSATGSEAAESTPSEVPVGVLQHSSEPRPPTSPPLPSKYAMASAAVDASSPKHVVFGRANSLGAFGWQSRSGSLDHINFGLLEAKVEDRSDERGFLRGQDGDTQADGNGAFAGAQFTSEAGAAANAGRVPLLRPIASPPLLTASPHFRPPTAMAGSAGMHAIPLPPWAIDSSWPPGVQSAHGGLMPMWPAMRPGLPYPMMVGYPPAGHPVPAGPGPRGVGGNVHQSPYSAAPGPAMGDMDMEGAALLWRVMLPVPASTVDHAASAFTLPAMPATMPAKLPRSTGMRRAVSADDTHLVPRETTVCDFPGCGRIFDRLANMRRHQKMHSGDRPYTCNICGKSFSRTDNLRQHELIHVKWVRPSASTSTPVIGRPRSAAVAQAGRREPPAFVSPSPSPSPSPSQRARPTTTAAAVVVASSIAAAAAARGRPATATNRGSNRGSDAASRRKSS